MTLPRTGRIGLGDINVELGRSRTAQISLDTAENGGYAPINPNSRDRPSSTNPAAVSEWYGYNHQANQPVPNSLILWRYLNDSGATLPFQIQLNNIAVVSQTTTGESAFGAPAGSIIIIDVRENPRRTDTQQLYVERNGQEIYNEVVSNSNIRFEFVVDAGFDYEIRGLTSSRLIIQ